jgi:UDP-glucose 4-epimerase
MSNKKILLTGGTGFIGSHTAVELIQASYEIVIIDDLSNSKIEVLDNIEKITGVKPTFIKLDMRDIQELTKVFEEHTFDAIIHFAAKKAVGESVQNPLLYYDVNINATLNLLKLMNQFGVTGLVFSSSCTVYGQPDQLPVTESTPFKPAESPYGNTKQICEEILIDFTKSNPSVHAVSLRYFNPVGAHDSALIGELPIGIPQNLVPFITQTAAGLREKLSVFGGNYATTDGSAVRDYIHVVDLAKAHVKAVGRLVNNENAEQYEYFNLGTGKGSTVLEVIKAFETATGEKLNYEIVDRRPGDVVITFANTSKANKELNWKAELGLHEMMASAWKWQCALQK